MAKLSPVYNEAQFINGVPANGAKVFTYAAGSSTKLATYTDEAGTTPQANPIILDARGEPSSPIWLAEGQAYKFVFTSSTDSDPPTSPIRTIDNVTGVGDAVDSFDQWTDSGVSPTYVSATQFTLPGDQTQEFQVNRRVKCTVTAGTVYGYISVSAYTSLTTVTVVLDSGNLDSGLSAVELGLITPDKTSFPILKDSDFKISGSSDASKRMSFEVDGFTPSSIRVLTPQDKNITIAGLVDIRNYLNGFVMSTAGSSTTITIGAGSASDSSNVVGINLSSAISKTTGAWAVGTGNGGLDTGVIANSTWYHFYAIRRPDTGVVDVVFSTNASSPTLPTNYTQYRYIGSAITDSSGNWRKFTQLGDRVIWATPHASASNATVSTTELLVTTLTPLGIKVAGIYNVFVSNSNLRYLRLYAVDDDDLTVGIDNMTLVNGSSSNQNQTVKEVITDTSSQVAWKADASTTGCYLQTLGFTRNVY